MLEKIIKYWNDKPFQSIIIIALIVRLLAAFFSQGYGMHDDHFLVIEASQSWVDGTDYNDWLPKTQRAIAPSIEPVPQGHSFFYVGIHFLCFGFFKAIGIADPKIKMLLIRLIHALFSLIVVVIGYKITLKLTNEKYARQVGLLLAVLWVMPFLSVRNLVEVVCIPLLLLGCWYLIMADFKKQVLWYFLLSGFVTGLAFSIRFQSAFFILGMGIYLLITKKFKGLVIFSLGTLISILAIQGIVDYIIWNRPFAELMEYVRYNIAHKYDYGANVPEMYPLVLIGLLIPPIGLFLFFGFFRTWRKYTILFIPVMLFFAFHLYFPNKQERFILPILPFIIILGAIGWNEWVEISKFWQRKPGLLKGCWVFFWIINLIMLPVFTLTYSKKSRIEAMYYLYKKEPVRQILIEDTNRKGVLALPNFYAGQWMVHYQLSKSQTGDSTMFGELKSNKHYYKEIYDKYFFVLHPECFPKYVLFIGNSRLDERVANLKSVFPVLKFEKQIESGFIDKIVYKLNPVNKNDDIFIYSTADCKADRL
jgi:hypothetical protein